jgi:hypothetical protein
MASNRESHSLLPSLAKVIKQQAGKKGELGKKPGDISPAGGRPFRPYLNKHVSLFKHLLEKPIVENPEEKEIRLQKEYLNQIFEEDFIKELCSLDRKIFLNLHALFKRIDMQQTNLSQTQQSFNPANAAKDLQDIIKDEQLAQSQEERNELDKQKLKMLIKILQSMMSPNSRDDGTIMQYDSVHQLKNLVKKYYIKKG